MNEKVVGLINSIKQKDGFTVRCLKCDQLCFAHILSANKVGMLCSIVLYHVCKTVLLKLFRLPRA